MTVEVKTRLSVDESDAAKALRKTSSGFKQLSKDATAAGGFIKQAMATAAGVYVPKMVGGAFSMAKSFFDVAAASQQSTKSFTGLYTMFRNIPFEKAAGEAGKMKDQLWNMAVALGEKPAEAYSTFQTQARAMGASTAEQMSKAKEQTQQLLEVASNMGIEVGELSGEFAMFAKAPRIMRGPMFDILRATGVFGKDLVTMNKNWTKLTESAKQGGLAKALAMQAEKLKGIPKTWEQQVNSVESILNKAKATIGQPILEAMMPIAEEFKTQLLAAMPELQAGGKSVGKFLAEKLKVAFGYIKEGIAYAKTHTEDIKKYLSDAADFVSSAFDKALAVVHFIWDHKELIAGVVIGSKAVSAAKSAVDVGKSVVGGVQTVMGTPGQTAVSSVLTLLSGAPVAVGAGAMVAMLAALGSFVWLGSELYKLYSALEGGLENTQNADAKLEAAEAELAAGRIDAAKRFLAESQAIQKTYSINSSQRSNQVTHSENIQASIGHAEQIADYAQSILDGVKIPEGLDRAFAVANQFPNLIEAYNSAAEVGNTEMMTQAATMLAQAGVTKDMITQAGLTVTGGLDSLANSISMAAFATYDEFIAAAGAISGGKSGAAVPDAAKLEKAAKGAGVNVNMSGGQTFNIKQDFKDQDPERVATVFHRDVVRAALSRRGSRITNIFGSL